MSSAPRSGRGLDPETLAAYVDGRLPPEERAKVEAELAADPESYEWLVQTLRAEQQIEVPKVPEVPRVSASAAQGRFGETSPELAEELRTSEGGPRVLPFGRRAVIGTVGSVLAAAAALVLVVRLQPMWWQSMWGPAVDPRFEKLVAAVGEERYFEGRLTGGFKYGPLRSVTRGPGDLSDQNLALLATAGELQKAAQADPSVENLHAWGVAQVLLGQLDEAATTLMSVSSARPSDARVLSDLAAAHVAKASARGSSGDARASVDFASRALGLSPGLSEARYNRALAYELLGNRQQAALDWREVLAHETSTAWRQSAEQHLQLLQSEPR